MARIRTIKPEFWSHPLIGKQDDATKLMAISLLNFADDEGFFHAEPNLVRGFCRPFDDNSTITRRCLDNLSKINYISICENENYGPIGKIEKFLDHQRIDRPNDSKLKDYYSTNNRRTIDEQSTLERKGKGREKEGKIFSLDLIELNNACKKYFEEKYITKKSLECFDNLIRIDKYTIEQIKQAILNARSEPFWDKNFLTPLKLRDKDKDGVLYIDKFLAIKSKKQEETPKYERAANRI